jgi:CheY-like chemotaxis protein
VRPHVLVIDDHATNLELMTHILERLGYFVTTARDGREGIAKAYDKKPDLIVSDIEMPEVDGFEVAKRLRADDSTRKIPLLAVTGLAMAGDRETVMAAGFDGYLSKPVHPQRFIEIVNSFVANRQVPNNANAGTVPKLDFPAKDHRPS